MTDSRWGKGKICDLDAAKLLEGNRPRADRLAHRDASEQRSCTGSGSPIPINVIPCRAP